MSIQGRNPVDTFTDLDTGAETDIISYDFVKVHKLKRANRRIVPLAGIPGTGIQTYGVFEVPFSITDSHGVTKEFIRPCTAIDRDPRVEGCPMLLSMTFLRDERVHLEAYSGRWWFETTARVFQLVRATKMRRICKNAAAIYAVIQAPQQPDEDSEVWLPMDEEDMAKPSADPEPPDELKDFKDVFQSENASILPPHKPTDHTIDLQGDSVPPHGPIYPLSPRELEELRKYLDENTRNGRIRPSKSPAGAPILFVPKRDGSLRLCVDYRGLNKVTIKNRYPLPLISEILDRISGSQFFSKIDVKDAYYRIRIKEGDEWKTAFRTRYGHYEYLVMPFGLTNAPATFQHYIHTALHDILDIFCVAYLDDILIFSKTRDEHTKHLREVLERLREAGLYAKASKCQFYSPEVDFLGFVINTEGVRMDPSRVEMVAKWEEPTTFHAIQVFLGFCNFYRRFIHGYSGIAEPLTALLKGSVKGKKPGPVTLNEDEKGAFRRLIAAFQEAPLLRHWDCRLPMRLETDASEFALAGILSQPDSEGIYHPIAFWSRKLKGPELRYGVPDKEMMAIVEAFKHWRHYLDGSPESVDVLTDHANLQTFMRQPKLNGRQARWCMFLAPFDFVIRHRPGSRNPADGPSRQPALNDEEAGDPRNFLPELKERLASAQNLDETLQITDRKGQRLRKGKKLRKEPRAPETDEPLIDWAVQEGVAKVYRVSRQRAKIVASGEKLGSDTPTDGVIDLVARIQASDPETQRLRRQVEGSERDVPEGYTVDSQGLLRFKGRLFVPTDFALRQELLQLHHDDPLAGHCGINRTMDLLQRKFHWRRMDRDVDDYVKHCRICQTNTSRRHKPYGTLGKLPQPKDVWEEISIDFVTGLPPVLYQSEEVDAIMVVVDRFSRFALFYPVRTDMTAGEFAQLFHNEVELRYAGAPKGIVSDRDKLFTSEFWEELCFANGVKRRMSTAWHPQTDGLTERTNQTLEHYLRCFTQGNELVWPYLLRTAEYACNNAVNATSKEAPFKVLMGRLPESASVSSPNRQRLAPRRQSIDSLS